MLVMPLLWRNVSRNSSPSNEEEIGRGKEREIERERERAKEYELINACTDCFIASVLHGS